MDVNVIVATIVNQMIATTNDREEDGTNEMIATIGDRDNRTIAKMSDHAVSLLRDRVIILAPLIQHMYPINLGTHGRETTHLDLSTTISHHAHPLVETIHPHHQREGLKMRWPDTHDHKTVHLPAHNDNAAALTHPPALAPGPQVATSPIVP